MVSNQVESTIPSLTLAATNVFRRITPRDGLKLSPAGYKQILPQLGSGQYHLAVAGGCVSRPASVEGCAPTRYREVVLTRSKLGYK